MKKTLIMLLLITILFVFTGCQSRLVSRITGKPLELVLPDDFDRPISFSAGRQGEKDLFYWTKSGQMKVKTYGNYGILEGVIVFKSKEGDDV